MVNSHAFRISGGTASIMSGVLLFIGHLINLVVGSDHGSVFGKCVIMLAHLALIFAFVGLHESQISNGIIGKIGTVFSIIGTTFVTAVVFVEISQAAGIDVSAIFDGGVSGTIAMVGPLFFVVGMVILGLSIIRNRVLPRIGGALLIIGTIIFSLGSVSDKATLIISVIGGGLTGLGFVWLGLFLLKNTGSKN